MGQSTDAGELTKEIARLQTIYDSERIEAKRIRRHLQLSALLMLKGNGTALNERAWYLEGIKDEDLDKLDRTVFRLNANRPKLPSNEQRLKTYLDESRMLDYFVGEEKKNMREAMEEGLKAYLQQNKGQWPGKDALAVKEQFYWNVIAELRNQHDDILFPTNHLFATSSSLKWRDFLDFCTPYLRGAGPDESTRMMRDLLFIYQVFPQDDAARRAFLTRCEPRLQPVAREEKPATMRKFLDEVRPVQNPYTGPKNSVTVRDLPEDAARQAFVNPYLQYYRNNPRSREIFLFIYQAFPGDDVARRDFINFCGSNLNHRTSTIEELLAIYQIEHLKEDFLSFRNSYKSLPNYKAIERKLIFSFLPRTYLSLERVLAALGAETLPHSARAQAFFETKLSDMLPAFWAQDLFLQAVRAQQGVINVHELDEFYKLDQEALFHWCQENGCQPGESSTERTIFNGEKSLMKYKTNLEVEDFIHYLDATIAAGKPIKLDGRPIAALQVVSILKQMLGLEPKPDTTNGGFAPYLGHSMYYAKPEAPKGDEMLGWVWFMMKKLGEKAMVEAEGKSDAELEKALQDAEDYKMSMVLAMLEASEISGSGVSTHCQTRMTGELMKLIAWHLPGSKIRPLIAAEDLPPTQSDTDVAMRILAAPERAQQLFNRMKKEDSGAIKTLIEKHVIEGTDPELWERYQAYYDDLYRRTRLFNDDESFKEFKKDEHILMRDGHGNLVSLYSAAGTLKATPDIVYHQAEFQAFEKTFAECMRKEFEEKRGLVY